MTYKQLAEKILTSFSEEQQNQDVTIHLKFQDEFIAVKNLFIQKEDDVLDSNHAFLEIEW